MTPSASNPKRRSSRVFGTIATSHLRQRKTVWALDFSKPIIFDTKLSNYKHYYRILRPLKCHSDVISALPFKLGVHIRRRFRLKAMRHQIRNPHQLSLHILQKKALLTRGGPMRMLRRQVFVVRTNDAQLASQHIGGQVLLRWMRAISKQEYLAKPSGKW